MCRMEGIVFPNCLSQKITLRSGYQVMFPVPGGDKLPVSVALGNLFVILTDSNIHPCFFQSQQALGFCPSRKQRSWQMKGNEKPSIPSVAVALLEAEGLSPASFIPPIHPSSRPSLFPFILPPTCLPNHPFIHPFIHSSQKYSLCGMCASLVSLQNQMRLGLTRDH